MYAAGRGRGGSNCLFAHGRRGIRERSGPLPPSGRVLHRLQGVDLGRRAPPTWGPDSCAAGWRELREGEHPTSHSCPHWDGKGAQSWLARSIPLRVTTSFRATAMSATFFGFPLASRRW